MAKITVAPGQRLRVIAKLAGSNMRKLFLTIDEFEVPDVSQAALDAAFADYQANQAAREAAFDADEIAAAIGELQQQFGDDVIINAVVEVFRTELNTLRALHALPDLAAGAIDGAIRNKIANP